MADHVGPTPWWKDALERVVWTFLEAVVAVIILDGTDVVNLETWQGALTAGVVAALAVVKTVAASRLGRRDAAIPSLG